MKAFRKVSIDIGITLGCVIIAWWIGGHLFEDEAQSETQRLIMDIAGFFAGIVIVVIMRLETFGESIENLEKQSQSLQDMIQGTAMLGAFCNALKNNTGLIHDVLNIRLNEYKRLLEDAAENRITIDSTQPATIIHYNELFKAIEHGAIIKAATVVLPTEAQQRIIVTANKEFIVEKRGQVRRIFVIPRNEQHYPAWERYMEEQNAAGIVVRFVFNDELPGTPMDDVFIVDKPRMATRAQPNSPMNDMYASVTITADHEEIGKLEARWNALFVAATDWHKDCLTKPVKEVA